MRQENKNQCIIRYISLKLQWWTTPHPTHTLPPLPHPSPKHSFGPQPAATGLVSAWCSLFLRPSRKSLPANTYARRRLFTARADWVTMCPCAKTMAPAVPHGAPQRDPCEKPMETAVVKCHNATRVQKQWRRCGQVPQPTHTAPHDTTPLRTTPLGTLARHPWEPTCTRCALD